MAWLIGLVSVVLAAAITGTYGQTGLTAAQKQQFVDAHNSLRGSVKPAATNMKTMVRVQLYLKDVHVTLIYTPRSCGAEMER